MLVKTITAGISQHWFCFPVDLCRSWPAKVLVLSQCRYALVLMRSCFRLRWFYNTDANFTIYISQFFYASIQPNRAASMAIGPNFQQRIILFNLLLVLMQPSKQIFTSTCKHMTLLILSHFHDFFASFTRWTTHSLFICSDCICYSMFQWLFNGSDCWMTIWLARPPPSLSASSQCPASLSAN